LKSTFFWLVVYQCHDSCYALIHIENGGIYFNVIQTMSMNTLKLIPGHANISITTFFFTLFHNF